MEKLKEIGELIRTQDNRITDAPIFIVQKRVRDYGYVCDYCDNYVWLEDGEGEVDEIDAAEFERQYQEDFTEPDGYYRVGYRDRWEFVTACFTEQGCTDFLERDGHNHGETRIYAEGSYRNEEYRAVREFLKGL